MTLHHGDCLDVMAAMEAESVDAIVTDPPYSIGFMGRKWDKHADEDAAFGYWLAGFTDGEGHFRVQEQSRGTYSCAFSIHLRRDDRAILERIRRFLGCGSVIDEKDTDTRNRMSKLNVQAKEDCLRVVEVFARYPLRAKKLRDFLPWAEAVVDWNGMTRGNRWHGRGDWSRLEALKARVESARAYRDVPWSGNGYQDWSREWGELALRALKPGGYMLAMGGTRTYHRMVTGFEDAGFEIRDCLVYAYASGFPKSKASLKPAWEPIVMARKPGPLRELAIDACRMPAADGKSARSGHSEKSSPAHVFGPERRMHAEPDGLGRWPANVILTDPIFDGDVAGVVGGGESGGGFGIRGRGGNVYGGYTTNMPETGQVVGYGDSGTYSRFFLIPKANRADREPVLGGLPERVISVWGGEQDDLTPGKKSTRPRTNLHPTVKPTELMCHLVRLVTPPGGTVLDPFLGSGTTALAAEQEGFAWIGIEREAEYVAIAEARLNGTQRGLGLTA